MRHSFMYLVGRPGEAGAVFGYEFGFRRLRETLKRYGFKVQHIRKCGSTYPRPLQIEG